jgi:hypothetical protein
MLLYTNKANNVFDFVDEKFVDRDISAKTIVPTLCVGMPPWMLCVRR